MSTDHSLRLFFALLPDAKIASRMNRMSKTLSLSCHGRAMTRHSLHLTLAFLGETPAERLESLIAIGLQVSILSGCTMSLTRLTRLNRSIVCLEPDVIPPELMSLYDSITSALLADHFPVEQRRFRPHITLVRRVSPTAPVDKVLRTAIAYPVRELALMSSDRRSDGSQYHALARWTLGLAALPVSRETYSDRP
jgi:2'-5' RNA ligase